MLRVRVPVCVRVYVSSWHLLFFARCSSVAVAIVRIARGDVLAALSVVPFNETLYTAMRAD